MEQLQPDRDALERYTTSLFGDVGDNIDLLIESYRELYNLDTLEKTFTLQAEDRAAYLERRNFLLVCAYNRDGRFLIINKRRQPRLVIDRDARLIGRTVDDYSSFCLEETANEMVERYTGGHISDLRPVCKMVNKFEIEDELITQTGIVFLALVDDIKTEKVEIYEIGFETDPPETMIFQNKAALELAIQLHRDLRFFPDAWEIEHSPGGVRNLFHRVAVKPLVKAQSSTRIRKALFDRMGQISSVIDVSCGDDEMIFSISEALDPDIVVANDINWSAMKRIMTKAREKNYHILFTNHHICEMPFNYRFDVAICKNTLHHIQNPHELVNALISLSKIAKRLLIVDIEDPKRSILGTLFNKYYELFLGDGVSDHRFLTKSQFRNLIRKAYPSAIVHYQDLYTIKGRYMMADVQLNGSSQR